MGIGKPARPGENTPTLTPRTSDIDAAVAAVFGDARIVPEEYADAAPERAPQVELVRFGGHGYGACFFGDTGIGKTYAATALARRLLRLCPIAYNQVDTRWYYPRNTLAWTSAPYLLARIRGTFRRRSGPSETDIIDEYAMARILLLDDLGAEKQTEFTGSTLYTILSERRNHRRFTIVTANKGLGDIAAWEPRIADRLAEMQHVALPNRNWRLRERRDK